MVVRTYLIIFAFALFFAACSSSKPAANDDDPCAGRCGMVNGVAADSAGNIFVAGYTAGAFEGNTNAGSDDIFLTKWNADGTMAWTKQWGTTSGDSGSSVAVDGAGRILVAGYTKGSLAEMSAGECDIFLSIVTEE